MDENDLLEIVNQLKKKSKDAFEVFYASYATRFYWRAVTRGLSREDAEEVVDDIFIRILTGVHTFNASKGNPEAWIMTICRNNITDKHRGTFRHANRKEELPNDGNADFVSDAVGPEEVVEQKEIDRAVYVSFKELNRADQDEILRGRGRGPERPAWLGAMQRWGEKFRACYEGVKV